VDVADAYRVGMVEAEKWAEAGAPPLYE
jgi:hypothetical protein